MNDFTKEELIVIEDGIGYVRHKSIEYRTALLKKIDAMIENYCEHDQTKSHTMNVRVCEKCHTIF
jgi:hypothetical protein